MSAGLLSNTGNSKNTHQDGSLGSASRHLGRARHIVGDIAVEFLRVGLVVVAVEGLSRVDRASVLEVLGSGHVDVKCGVLMKSRDGWLEWEQSKWRAVYISTSGLMTPTSWQSE